MELFTFYVGQGSLAVLVGDEEAIVIDARMPGASDKDAVFVKEALAVSLAQRRVRGLILTSFDSDHADVRTVGWVLGKYRPDWVMYPSYWKDSLAASQVFECIAKHEDRSGLRRISVRIDRHSRHLDDDLSDEFTFEAFSPHIEDMNNSNNSSLVVKVEPREDGFSYLVTGDTEMGRWPSIAKFFARHLDVDVLAAPHHGASNSMDAETLALIDPSVVLISAGVDSRYDHPRDEIVKLYEQSGADVFSTHRGESFVTYTDDDGDICTEPLDDYLDVG